MSLVGFKLPKKKHRFQTDIKALEKTCDLCPRKLLEPGWISTMTRCLVQKERLPDKKVRKIKGKNLRIHPFCVIWGFKGFFLVVLQLFLRFFHCFPRGLIVCSLTF